jgi:hypothetical protein
MQALGAQLRGDGRQVPFRSDAAFAARHRNLVREISQRLRLAEGRKVPKSRPPLPAAQLAAAFSRGAERAKPRGLPASGDKILKQDPGNYAPYAQP